MAGPSNNEYETMSYNMPSFFVAVEGNIASGKSTILSLLSNRMVNNYTLRTLPEPTTTWTNTPVGDLLHLAATDPTLYGESLQNLITTTLLEQRLDAKKSGSIALAERSLESAKEVFLKNYEQHQQISRAASFCLKRQIKMYGRFYPKKDAVVFLNTEAKVCHERLEKSAINNKTRGTLSTSDCSITLGLLQDLEKLYRQYINRETMQGMQVLVVDDNGSCPEEIVSHIINWLRSITLGQARTPTITMGSIPFPEQCTCPHDV